VEHQLTPLRCLGIPIAEEIRLQVGILHEAQERVLARMKGLNLLSGRFILISPFATLFTKEWELSRFAELSRRLRGVYGLPIVAIAGPSERERLQALVSLASEAIIGLELLPLEDLIAWIDQCGLYIGNDSGPTHLAAARQKKTVALWGSSDYHAWHPWGTDYQLLRADLPCIPCPGYRCYEFDSPRCIESISVDHVVRAVERLKPFT
jgi:heptosyltransferase-3